MPAAALNVAPLRVQQRASLARARTARPVLAMGIRQDTAATHESMERVRLSGGAAIADAREKACSLPLDPQAAAARLAHAPPTVQDFILRWGRREGIEAHSFCEADWVVLETMDEVPTQHHSTVMEDSFRDKQELQSVDNLQLTLAERLALAPTSVQAFISRWGRREGIDAAAA